MSIGLGIAVFGLGLTVIWLINNIMGNKRLDKIILDNILFLKDK